MLSAHTTLIRFLTFGGLLLSCGCMSEGVKAEHDKLSLIQPGVTTRAQIEQSFGPPDAVDSVGDLGHDLQPHQGSGERALFSGKPRLRETELPVHPE